MVNELDMELKKIPRPWQQKRQFPGYGNKYNNDTRYQTKAWRTDRNNFMALHPICSGPDSICQKEGRLTPSKVCDHIIPVSKGGDFWNWDNRQALCTHCNAVKTAKDR